MSLALFDLDGTLIPGDSDHAFGEYIIALGWADALEHKARNDGFYADYMAGTLDVAAYTDFATSAWRHRPLAQVDAALEVFVHDIVRPMLGDAARDLVERHRAAGDELVLVTATNDAVTRPIARLLGIPTLIATELERDDGGRATGRVQGVPSFQEGKVVRVQSWLADRGTSLARLPASHFYSDSANDIPLLEAVTHPVATNPSASLERHARARGWPVLKLYP
jgi:HAD superfamily hydrolase (TIGR01490 family)